jgi:hypothetical protein
LGPGADHHAERRAVEDALHNLRVLRQTELAEDEI